MWFDFLLKRIEIHFRLLSKDEDKGYNFHCDECKRWFKTRKCINLHIKREHLNTKKRYTCDICEENFASYYKMKKHYKIIHHMKSSKEKYKSNVQYTLEEYNDIFSSRSKECPVCHKHYLDSFKMRRHLRSIHSSYFSEELQLMIESRIKSKDTGDYTLEQWRDIVATKSNECPVCHKTYSTPSRMRRHLREIHRAQKKYICDVCGKQFSTPRRVREHRKKTHEESGNGEDIFECDICKKIDHEK